MVTGCNELERNGTGEWNPPEWLTCHELAAGHRLYIGQLPSELIPGEEDLRAWWELHPAEFPEILMYGRPVKAPRWQQAFGMDYRFAGRVSRALPIPALLAPLLAWSTERVDHRINGLLLNWYDAGLEHRIGPHRDKVGDLVVGTPIVTVSLGAERVFRMRPWRSTGVRDFAATHGTVFVMPFSTNLAWTHEVPHRAHDRGRRISVTARAFKQSPVSARAPASVALVVAGSSRDDESQQA